MGERTYIAIDLKSFYASAECVERGLDPLTTNLVVADLSRTEKTICLAVSPSLKAYGIPGRPRLFEVVQKVEEINALRRSAAPGGKFAYASSDDRAVHSDPKIALDYITATPRMALYMEKSAQIYDIYLKYVAPEDLFAYSIDEVFLDATGYLAAGRTAEEFARTLILDVLNTTGITATAGVGSNLYLAKVAIDVKAKHMPADANGVRLASLNGESYRRELWGHRPLTDFWRVGRATAQKLEARGLYTMGDVARCSLQNEELLYKLFGVNAELLVDHAWGWEPCTMADVKAYRPQSSSLGTGQVLKEPYPADKARLVMWEMADALALDLVDKRQVTDQLVLTVGYDRENLADPERRRAYRGETTADHYGRAVPKHAHGTVNLSDFTSSARVITEAAMALFDRIVDPSLLARRLNLTATHTAAEGQVHEEEPCEQMDLFADEAARAEEAAALDRERRKQEAVLEIKRRYGKNAILKGKNLEAGATARERNGQIGGHRA